MKKLTLQQLRLAGKLYGLSIMAQMQDSETGCVYTSEVREAMSKQAIRALARLGISRASIDNEDTAVRFAQALKPAK